MRLLITLLRYVNAATRGERSGSMYGSDVDDVGEKKGGLFHCLKKDAGTIDRQAFSGSACEWTNVTGDNKDDHVLFCLFSLDHPDIYQTIMRR